MTVKMNWLTLSLIALCLLSVMSMLIVSLTRKGYPVSFVLIGVGVAFTVFYTLQTFVFSPHQFPIHLSTVLLLGLIGLLSVLGNLAYFRAANDAPNAGLAVSIGAGLQAALISVLAVFFLKDKLTPLQILGIILAVISVFLINLGSAPAGKSI